MFVREAIVTYAAPSIAHIDALTGGGGSGPDALIQAPAISAHGKIAHRGEGGGSGGDALTK